MLQAEAKYYCVDELVLGTEQSLGKLGVEVRLALLQNLSRPKIKDDFQGVGCGTDLQGALDHQPEGGTGLNHSKQYEACSEAAHQ